MGKILLVSPAFEYHAPRDIPAENSPSSLSGIRAFMAPLALAILASLTPEDIKVGIWDEAMQGCIDDSTDFQEEYHLIGITGYSSQIERVKTIAGIFRSRGLPVVIGGPGVSSNPERYSHTADTLFIGDAELTWPRFIEDWKAGTCRRIYRQVTKPDMATSPIPRWDSLKDHISKYFFGPVQTTRGCPFDCEFCDVPYIFGHRLRLKPRERVLEEVQLLHSLGSETIFFCDDNFIGNQRYARGLLEGLIALNNSLPSPMNFYTQMTLNVAKHDDLLALLADANFAGLFIGIETINKESLKETNKIQNYQTDILADIQKIQSYGLPITAGIIVGFDHDTPEIFDRQFEFLQEAGIPKPRIHLLCAPEGTRLWYRLQGEGRLLLGDDDPVMPRTTTNIIPHGMSRLELFQGYLDLHERISNWSNFASRIKKFISGINRQPKVKPRQLKVQNQELYQNLFFSLDGEIQRAIFDILQHTRRQAPFMFQRVIAMILMELNQSYLLERLRSGIRRQIELESSEGYEPEFIRIVPGIPEGFEESYHHMFPDIYERVYQELADQEAVKEAVIEIFTRLLLQGEEGGITGNDLRQDELNTLCAQSITWVKSLPGTACRTEIHKEIHKTVPAAEKKELAKDILHFVEQELKLRRQGFSHGQTVNEK